MESVAWQSTTFRATIAAPELLQRETMTMGQVQFELVVVTSMDGYIARFSGEAISLWTSPEEQARFRGCFAKIDWSFMGRVTHNQVFNPDRRRVIFSHASAIPEWRHVNHLWLDPDKIALDEMLALIGARHPARRNLILGGTGVHDWFWHAGLIDSVQLAIEPVEFGGGVELFSGQGGTPPLDMFRDRGFRLLSSDQLNVGGSVWHTLSRH